jgi:hypothetical protein
MTSAMGTAIPIRVDLSKDEMKSITNIIQAPKIQSSKKKEK